jgi:hypothetical protein
MLEIFVQRKEKYQALWSLLSVESPILWGHQESGTIRIKGFHDAHEPN